MSRGRTANSSLLAVLGGGEDFSDDEFQASGDDFHVLTPMSKQAQRPPGRTRATAARKTASAPPPPPTTTRTTRPAAKAATASIDGGPHARATRARTRGVLTETVPNGVGGTTATAATTTTKKTGSQSKAGTGAAATRRAAQSRRLQAEPEVDELVENEYRSEEERVDDDTDMDGPDDLVEVNAPDELVVPAVGVGARPTRSRKRAASTAIPPPPTAAVSTTAAAPPARQARGRAAKAMKTASSASAGAGGADINGLDGIDDDDNDDAMAQLQTQLNSDTAPVDGFAPDRGVFVNQTRKEVFQPASSVNQGPAGLGRWRAIGSELPTDRTSESALRRQLAETKRQLDQLEIRYESVVELATKEAKDSFDNLLQATEQQAKIQDQLIESLRHEIAVFKARTTHSSDLEDRLAGLEAENDRLVRDRDEAEGGVRAARAETKRAVLELDQARAECDRLSTEVNSLTTSFQMLEKDNKMLSTKLASAAAAGPVRSVASSADGPGHHHHRPISTAAGKGGGPASRTGGEDSHAQRTDKLRLELYCDMTNLLIHSIKADTVDGEAVQVYDCSQTGSNGTLRFQLTIPTSGRSVADAMGVTYTPVIDPKNDGRLLETLPDYLQEDIEFQRDSLFRLHRRIVDSLEAQPEAESDVSDDAD